MTRTPTPPATTPDPAAPATSTPGAWLRQARQARGLAPEEAARRIRTRTAVIQALENDQYRALGAPVFVRMYLVRYAELLGLPEHQVLARYKALGVDQPPPLRVAHPSGGHGEHGADPRWLAYPAAFALIGWLGWMVSQQLPQLAGEPEPLPAGLDAQLAGIEDPPAAPVAAPAEPPPVPKSPLETVADELSPADETVSLALLESAATPGGPTAPPAPATEPAVPVEAPDPTATPAAESEPPQPPQVPEQYQLVLEFSEECWVEVQDARGKQLVYGLLRADDTRQLSGPAPFSIKLGNAQAVRISLNGQPVERSVYLPERGTVSRFVLDPPVRG